MDVLGQVVTCMSKEQVRYFKMFMRSAAVTENRKDLTLFDFIRRHEAAYDDEKIFRKIYPKGDKNSFYRLKNRLLRDLACSLSVQHFDEDELVHALRLLALVRFYFTRNKVHLAH